jgi:prepilin-type N-terminal cleavage/methylation domain-containing protein/prepilin-type processing-associated H-X9-DG protein
MKRTSAFTLIELLVVIAIIALLVSILLPSLNRAKALAKKTVCMSQIKGMGLCALMYADSNNDCLPMAKTHYDDATQANHWAQVLSEYAGEGIGAGSYQFSEIFASCPEYDAESTSTAAWNPGYGAVIMIHSLDGTAPTAEESTLQNWKHKGVPLGLNGTVTYRFFKRSEFSDSTRRGWFGDSTEWHIGGGPNPDYVEGEKWPTWCLYSDKPFAQGGYGLGKDPERHVDSSNIWFIDGHAKDYKYDIGGNAFYDIEKLPF